MADDIDIKDAANATVAGAEIGIQRTPNVLHIPSSGFIQIR